MPRVTAAHPWSAAAGAAAIAGGAGALVGVAGFASVVLGDELPLDVVSGIAVGLAVFGLIAVALTRDAPASAAVGMTVPPIGYAALFANSLGSWWTRYQDAPAMTATALFVVSGGLFVLGAALAAQSSFAARPGDDVTAPAIAGAATRVRSLR